MKQLIEKLTYIDNCFKIPSFSFLVFRMELLLKAFEEDYISKDFVDHMFCTWNRTRSAYMYQKINYYKNKKALIYLGIKYLLDIEKVKKRVENIIRKKRFETLECKAYEMDFLREIKMIYRELYILMYDKKPKKHVTFNMAMLKLLRVIRKDADKHGKI